MIFESDSDSKAEDKAEWQVNMVMGEEVKGDLLALSARRGLHKSRFWIGEGDKRMLISGLLDTGTNMSQWGTVGTCP